MKNKLLTENYDREKHAYLENRKDAFGNPVELEEGFRFLENTEKIKKGDYHFDIYGGWVTGGEDYYAENGHYAGYYGGRWTAWARKIK